MRMKRVIAALPAKVVTYSSNQVADLTGVSLRQIQWWDERRVLIPRKEGHRRIFTEDDYRKVSALAQLRRAGFSLQVCRKLLHGKHPEIEQLMTAQESIVILIGANVFVAKKWDEVATLAVGKMVRLCVVKHV